MNTLDEPTTVYVGSSIAMLEPVELPREVDTVMGTATETSKDKQEMIWWLVQDCEVELNTGERVTYC